MSCFEKGQQWSGLICLCQVKGWPFVAWILADSSEVAPFYALKGWRWGSWPQTGLRPQDWKFSLFGSGAMVVSMGGLQRKFAKTQNIHSVRTSYNVAMSACDWPMSLHLLQDSCLFSCRLDHFLMFFWNPINAFCCSCTGLVMFFSFQIVHVLQALQKIPEVSLRKWSTEACREMWWVSMQWCNPQPVSAQHWWGMIARAVYEEIWHFYRLNHRKSCMILFATHMEIYRNNRRKFRSQTSDNMDRWKAEQGRGREKRKIRREKIRRERVRRKKMQMREKVGKSRNTVFFQWFVAPEGRKVGLLKRRVRSQLARREMKNCTPLWREAHFQVKMYKTHHSRTTFGSWDVEKVHAVVARSTFWSQKC